MALTVEIYQKDWLPVSTSVGNLVAVLRRASSISANAEADKPDDISFEIPSGDDDVKHIKIGRIVIIRDSNNSAVVSGGVITGPLDKSTRPRIKVRALGMMSVLGWAETPWRYRLKTRTPASQINELLFRKRYFRHNTKEDFDAGTNGTTAIIAIASGTITSADAYFIALATTGLTGAGSAIYALQGTFRGTAIFIGNPTPVSVAADRFDRFRYEAELGNMTDVSFSLRSAPDSSGVPGAWSAYSAFQKRGLPDDQQLLGITGFAIGATHEWVQIRARLTTQDTLVSPAVRAYEAIGNYPFEITGGTISLPTSSRTYTGSFISHHRMIRQIVADNNAEMKVTAGFTLNVVSRLGTTIHSAVLEEKRNFIPKQYREDDRDLSNDLSAFGGDGEGLSEIYASARSTSSQVLYGIRTGRILAPGTTLATVQNQATNKLSKVSSPKIFMSGIVYQDPPVSYAVQDSVRIRIPRLAVDEVLVVKVRRDIRDSTGEYVELDFDTIDATLTGDLADTGGAETNEDTKEFKEGKDGSSGSSGTDGTGGSSGTAGTGGSSGTSGNTGTSGTSGTSGESPDYAELVTMRKIAEIDGGRDFETGDVIVISKDIDNEHELCTIKGDHRVSGVFSANPGFLTNVNLKDGIPMALAGVVPCKIDATHHKIKRGDLLQTSNTPGHGEWANPKTAYAGTVFAKALQPFPRGRTGQILVLINVAL